MKLLPQSTARVLITFVLLACRPAVLADTRADVESALRADLLNRMVTLRGFWQGRTLRFDRNGVLTAGGPAGVWTLDGHFFVRQVNVSAKRLTVSGERVALRFDGERRQFVSVPYGGDVFVHIALPARELGLAEARALLGKVLLSGGDKLSDIAPEHWRPFLRRVENSGDSAPEPVSTDSFDEPPRLLDSLSIEYPMAARRLGMGGLGRYELTVGADGLVKRIFIHDAVGYGIDDAVVRAAPSFKFSPATRGGLPVPSNYMLKIEFGFVRKK